MTDQDRFNHMFEYIPSNGHLHHKNPWVAGVAGIRAGHPDGNPDGNVGRVIHDWDMMLIHKEERVVWIMLRGAIPEGMEVVHINGVMDDNRICNLRLEKREQNWGVCT